MYEQGLSSPEWSHVVTIGVLHLHKANQFFAIAAIEESAGRKSMGGSNIARGQGIVVRAHVHIECRITHRITTSFSTPLRGFKVRFTDLRGFTVPNR